MGVDRHARERCKDVERPVPPHTGRMHRRRARGRESKTARWAGSGTALLFCLSFLLLSFLLTFLKKFLRTSIPEASTSSSLLRKKERKRRKERQERVNEGQVGSRVPLLRGAFRPQLVAFLSRRHEETKTRCGRE